MTGIYAILNIETDMYYIGSAISLRRRWEYHKHQLKNNCHHSKHLQNSWNKNGHQIFIFVVLEFCEISELLNKEQIYLDDLKPIYNTCLIAGSCTGIKRSKETRAKMSAWQIGRKMSDEAMAKTKKALTGRICSDEHKLNIGSGHRKHDKWPHELGSLCRCKECHKLKKKLALDDYHKKKTYERKPYIKSKIFVPINTPMIIK